MTAKLTYEIIMTLPREEMELLLNMLEPHFEKFDIDDLLDDHSDNETSKEEMIRFLIKTVFSKCKHS